MLMKGKIVKITSEVKIGESSRKITIVVEETVEREFKESIAIDIWNDKIIDMAHLQVGDIVNAGFSTNAKENDGKYFNSVRGWKMEVLKPVNNTSNQDDEEDSPF